MLSPDGLTMAQNKVQIIQDWPKPQKVQDIQSFLGFTNFYRRFIYGYSRIALPLMALTRKGIPWHFTEECCSAFNTLKKAFTTAPVLMHWLDDGTSILKRGIVTMPLPIHRTISPYLQPNSWCRPFELLPSSSQPYEDLLSWIQNDSILTSSPIYETTLFPPNTSIPSQTKLGPKPQIVYFGIQDAYMSLTWAISDYMFSSTCMTIPLQAIMAKWRHFMQSKGNTTGPDFKPSSQNIARHAPPVHATNPCATDPTDFSSNSWSPICHGIQSLWISLRNSLCLLVMTQSWLLLIDSPSRLYSFQPRYDHFWSAGAFIHHSCLFEAWCPEPHHFQPRSRIHLTLLPISWSCSQHEASLYLWLSSWRWRTNQMN